METMSDNPLGKKTPIPSHYAPELLFPISRSLGRDRLANAPDQWRGFDRWSCYEFSHLLDDGKPTAGIFTFHLAATTPSIVESKSLKLYLAGFNYHQFPSEEDAIATVKRDLQSALKDPLNDWQARLDPPHKVPESSFEWGECIDSEKLSELSLHNSELTTSGTNTEHFFHSHLLRTLCPITSQPDWATVWVNYRGAPLNRSLLLAYLVSLRNHQGYHESCCEEIFITLQNKLKPEYLAVGCFFTRRGGIDITPFRWSEGYPHDTTIENGVPRVLRQ
jgi:7-cyano-7-deazaguanine reductase